jgi:membrane-associated protease RseP (regulator of RpoE activity)
MKHLTRLISTIGVALLIAAGALTTPARAQMSRLVELMNDPSPLLRSSSQGYLGVDLADVDQERARQLKLAEVRGAIVTLIDHDAPAGQMGLKVNDVVLKLNDQTVESAEQLRRMLRELPAGRKVSLAISRDGNVQTLAVELADRRQMEHDIWNKIGAGGDLATPGPGKSILSGGGDVPSGAGGFHMPFFGSTLNVGALVEPLTGQMAEYLGVPSGLMIKQVARKSEAATAGLKAFDVILKVGTDGISTVADWDRALRAYQGKSVQVTILRERRQQTVTLQVDSKHHGAVNFEPIWPKGEAAAVAELDSEGDGALWVLGLDYRNYSVFDSSAY